jgi:hypothetical protein
MKNVTQKQLDEEDEEVNKMAWWDRSRQGGHQHPLKERSNPTKMGDIIYV